MEATIFLARPGESACRDEDFRRRSVTSLAQRFRDARVRLFLGDVEPLAQSARAGADFDALVLVERRPARRPNTPRPEETRPDRALAWLTGARAYGARSRTLLERSCNGTPGERTPGLVFVATAVRAPGLSHAEFDTHWRDHHGPIALRHHAGLCSYEQIALERPLTPDAPALDGVALLYFASADDLRDRFYDSDAGRAAIRADTERFLDLPRCNAALMSETVVRA